MEYIIVTPVHYVTTRQRVLYIPALYTITLFVINLLVPAVYKLAHALSSKRIIGKSASPA